MQQQVVVSPVLDSDFVQWLPYWLGYQEFYKVQLTEQVTTHTWAQFLKADSPVNCAVARQGDQLLGFVTYVFHASTWAETDYCYLEDLFVSASARGQHVGKQLIEFVQQQAQAHGCARLYWHTQETNHTAQRLYDWIAEKPGIIEYRMPL